MRLNVPANYDAGILPELAANGVKEIYGKLPSDVVGGGRPSYMATPLSWKKLKAYMSAVRANGMEFNYLLNAACFGNDEWTRPFYRGVRRLLDDLAAEEVPWLTVAAPYLLQIIKKHYPQFKVKIGIYAQIDTAKRARYWQDEGADAINLESFSINRDFPKLKLIREAVSCDLVLIANHFCQPNCPYQIQHQNGHAHASNSNSRYLIDYPIMQCQTARLSDPTRMISSGWIRPEDLHHYEDIGYDSFKLLERNIPSADLMKRVKAYYDRSFDGNFAELIFSWGFREKAPGFSWLHFFKNFKPWHMRGRNLAGVATYMREQGMFFARGEDGPPVVIDSKAIPDGFLRRFINPPGGISCNDLDCGECGYCGAIAEKAVHIEPQYRSRVLGQFAALQDKLLDGGM